MRSSGALKRGVKRGGPLKDFTTFGIGGPAEFFSRPRDSAALSAAIRYCRKNSIPVRVIGSGSNILCADRGIKGAVIKLDAPPFVGLSSSGNRVRAGAGVTLAALIRYCVRRGLSGAEFLAGIPGTVGGGLVMNCGVAKPRRLAIGDIIEEVRVMDHQGKARVLPASRIKFGYRDSGLSRWIITGAGFKLRRSSPRKVRAKLREFMLRRRGQDYRFPSAGCVFKNPAPAPAGRLIEECGLKGRSVGGARISEKHANFIVNTGNASCSEVLKLIRLAQRRVRQRFGISLEPEIRIWK